MSAPWADDPRVMGRMTRFTGPAGEAVLLDPEPLPFRLSVRDYTCRELAVLTVHNGRLCASYDDDDLDAAARAFLDAVLAAAAETDRKVSE